MPKILCLLICLTVSPFAFAQVTPSCGVAGVATGLVHETFDTTGYTGGSPANAAAFQTLVDTYAIPAELFGSGIALTVNGAGNPYGTDERYLSVFSGFIEIPTSGTYTFAVDGDDAVEVLINGTPISGYYGLHAEAGSGQNPGSVFLAAGFHEITFRHHENTGGDNYFLYWQQPSDTGLSIVPSSVLRHCPGTITLLPDIIPSCTNRLNGLELSTYDKTGFGHPANEAQYNTLVTTYGVPANLFGTGFVNTINTPPASNNNPFNPGTDSNYLTIINGYINVPTDGTYFFGVDGDDAVQVLIGGNVVSGFYGGHGRTGGPVNIGSINLEAGYHEIEFHHEEISGGDSYHLYWQPPGAASFVIVPNSVLEFCSSITLNPDIAAPCAAPASGLFLSTYDQSPNNTHPNNTTEFANLISTYVTSANLFGTGILSNIDTTGSNNNPYQTDADDRYISIFEGLLLAPVDGLYQIGVDGDDAVEVSIDGTILTGYYGGHGRSGAAVNPVTIGLEAGYHLLEFHHEEINGGDNYGFYWLTPSSGSSSLSIVPNANLFNCPKVATLNVSKNVSTLFDPINCSGAACGAGDDPKAIPGSISTYSIEVINNGLGTTVVDTVNIDDALPSNTALFVGDLNGSGLPVRFFDGDSSNPDGTGCTATCSNLSMTTANITYSNNNGVSYGYTATPDADGYDSNITNIRIQPTGIFSSDVFNPPRIRIELQTRLEN